MAFALFYISSDWYLFFITPLLFSLPVLGMIYVTIRGGRCRCRILASLTGLVLTLSYYGGYWGLNYFCFLSYYGEKAQPILDYETGSKGFFGFIRFYCQNSTIESYPNTMSKDKQPDKGDEIFSYIFYGGELIILLAIGIRMPYVLSQRIFFEQTKRWAKSKTMRFRITDLEELQRIIYQKDWTGLQRLPKLPKFGQQTAYLEFIIEFCKKGITTLPVYVSIKSLNMGDKSLNQGKRKADKSVFGKFVIKQMALPGTELQGIAQALPEWKIPCPVQAACQSYTVNPNQAVPCPTPAGDFREKAVAASLSQVGQWSSVNMADMDASVCLCIPPEHRVSVKKMAIAKIALLVVGILCIFGGLGIAVLGTQFTVPQDENLIPLSAKSSEDLTPLGIAIVSIGASFFVLAIVMVFGHLFIFTTILKRALLRRPGSLFAASGHPKLKMALLEDSNTYHIRKLATEDICLYHVDKQRQRLVMEGCNHRYMIRGRDITRMEPLKTGPEIAIGVYYKIGDTQLAVVMQIESIKWYALNPLFSINSANRFIKRLCADLGVQI